MQCPRCHRKTVVVDSRKKGKAIRRRRRCEHEGHRFNTLEIPLLEGEKSSSVMNALEALRAVTKPGRASARPTGERATVSPVEAQVGSHKGRPARR